MVDWINLFFFVVSCAVLLGSAYYLIKSLRYIARFLHISEYLAGFIILAIGTSLPELFVGISSALGGLSSLSLGNVIGANILDLTLIIGIPVLISRGIKIKSKTIRKDTFHMFLLILLPLLLTLLGKGLSRLDGAILLFAFGFYIWKILRKQHVFEKLVSNGNLHRGKVAFNFALFFISLLVLFFSSKFVIDYASLVAIDFLVSPLIIGIFVLSFGTTLPELVTGATAAIEGKKSMSVSTIMGTVVTNSTLVLGVVALINPFLITDFVYFITSAFFLALVAFLFLVFMSSGDKLDWREGLALVLFYVLFLMFELNLEGIVGVL